MAGPSTFEFCHNTPSGEVLAAYVIKHGQFRHHLASRDPPPRVPIQWVISSGRPRSGIEGLRMWAMKDWGPGIYEGPPLLWTRLVVVSELRVERSTLLLRLLGAGQVLKDAITELKMLEAEAPERLLALPILVRLRLEVPADPTKRTNDDQEFLMDTQDIVENFRREAFLEGERAGFQEGERAGFQEGERAGFQQGERAVLLRLLRRRFGPEVDTHVEQRIVAASSEQLEIWAERVLSAATLAELFAD
jgi:hypothetical protein